MTVDFSRLRRNWVEWTRLARMTRVSVSTECGDCQISFKSDDQSFHLRQDGAWWVIDAVDDRGHRYDSTAKFSTFDLAEAYLIWNWGSVSRSAVGAKSLGRELHARGMDPNVETAPTERDYFVELRASKGAAILAMSDAAVFSHLMSKSVEDVERMVKEGVT
ncbi:hypothetical protein [Mycolicibacterium sp. F2034L]|uniref:hypothetical protein n=1 Tax=Mycolicibacterium sp. F2034L TaxID=2926422 RepID=UPI001FF2DB04|nr:hypothetical protein [Mycolicibacterium sp. F2034L]MCK0173857.1 hypothetical protein [Mycolicibacterium sp. F2034L]